MTNKDVFNLYEGLNEIAQDKQIKFNIQLSYSLAYNKKILEPYYEAIIETRDVLFEKYGTRAEEGWKIPKEKVADFQKEWQDFMGVDNSLELKKIRLQTIPNTEINIDLMSKLLPIIIE